MHRKEEKMKSRNSFSCPSPPSLSSPTTPTSNKNRYILSVVGLTLYDIMPKLMWRMYPYELEVIEVIEALLTKGVLF